MSEFPELSCTYCRTDEERWSSSFQERSCSFPEDKLRLRYSNISAKSKKEHYIMEAIVARHLHRHDYNIWHERYRLVDYITIKKQDSFMRENTEELRPLLGAKRHDRLIEHFRKSGKTFCNTSVSSTLCHFAFGERQKPRSTKAGLKIQAQNFRQRFGHFV